MDFVFRVLFVQFLALGLLVPFVRPQTGGTDCNGKDYLCLDDVRFQLCVDYGDGRPTTVNDEVQQCPTGTFCSNSGHFECDSFVPPSTTAAPQVGDAEPAPEPTESVPEVVEEETTLPPAEEVASEAPEATTAAVDPEVSEDPSEATEAPQETQEPQEQQSTVASETETEASSDQPTTTEAEADTEAETETEAAPESTVPPTESSSQSSDPEEPEVTEGVAPEATDAPAPEETTAAPEASPEPEQKPEEPTEQVTEEESSASTSSEPAEEEATAAPTTTDEPGTEESSSTGASDEPTDSNQASEVPSTEHVTDEAEEPASSPTESAPEAPETTASEPAVTEPEPTSKAPAGSGSDESGSSGSEQDSDTEEPSGESAGSGSNEATTVAAPVAPPSNEPAPFVCQTAGRFPHPSDCHKYFICFWLPFGLYNLEQSCLPGFAYNPTLERCTADQSVCFPGQFTCLAPGRFPDLANPTGYFWCVWNVLGGYVQYNLQCPLGQVFNPFRLRCAFVVAGRSLPVGEPLVGEEEAVAAAAAAGEPALVDEAQPTKLKVKFECLEEGTFADPNNCGRYFVCTLKKLDKFKKSKFKCVTGERFDALVGGCVPDVDALCE